MGAHAGLVAGGDPAAEPGYIFAESYPDPQYRQQVLKFVAEAKGDWTDFKTRVRDGRVIDTTWVRVHLSDGTSIGIGQDITERKQAEEKVQQAERELRLVIDTVPAQVARTLPDGSLDLVNERWRRYFGLSLKEALLGGLKDVIHPEDRAEYLDQWRTAVASGEPFEREARLRRADGEYRWVLSRSVPLRDELGKSLSGMEPVSTSRIESALRRNSKQQANSCGRSQQGFNRPGKRRERGSRGSFTMNLALR